jgi:DNA repair exonuclease SbcCD nuclease subunit
LGHIHMRRVLSERPWIVFPGNLQGRHSKETGSKGCSLVTVEDNAIVAVEHRSLDVLRWAAIDVDATGTDVALLTGRLATAVRGALETADGRPLLARVTLTGATDLHGTLLGDTDQLAAECRAAAIETGGELWVETVRVATRPAQQDMTETLAPLRAAFAAGLDDPALVAELMREFVSLRQKLPAAARDGVELPQDEETLRALAEDAWQIAADALTGSDPS